MLTSFLAKEEDPKPFRRGSKILILASRCTVGENPIDALIKLISTIAFTNRCCILSSEVMSSARRRGFSQPDDDIVTARLVALMRASNPDRMLGLSKASSLRLTESRAMRCPCNTHKTRGVGYPGMYSENPCTVLYRLVWFRMCRCSGSKTHRNVIFYPLVRNVSSVT